MTVEHAPKEVRTNQDESLKQYLERATVFSSGVRVWRESVSIPTYEIGRYETIPIFLEKRVYQGSAGSVYPYPITEKIEDKKHDKEWIGLFLENEYVKIMVMPELGGRIQMAYDKTRKRHFVYFNQVIKPALVGLTGPWISGGIEFNWPQHHRPSTYLSVDFVMEEHGDGGASILVNEVERMGRTKGMARFTLSPGKAYIEISVRLYNRTSLPQTFLWWANPAVAVNDDYQSVFPPDVNAVFDHGKRDVSEFPIARGVYYKVDYSPGTDISRYKNIPVPTSYMAIRSDYDFVGGYENDTRAGLLHVANHHVSPGKKQWTWGCGDFGVAWDRNLTDEDGPYIELMTGVFTDNQPDFSWLAPYEEKNFTQYFMPYSEVGMVKNATRDALINIDRNGDDWTVKLYTTSEFRNCRLLVRNSEEVVLERTLDISPEAPQTVTCQFVCNENKSITASLLDAGGRLLVSAPWKIASKETIPKPAQAADLPQDIEQVEQLFLTGQHLEQYRHATCDPLDYYDEALRRDPADIRCNNSKGKILLRRGRFAEARTCFEKAVETMTQHNPNPYDGEPLYNLGLVLQLEKEYDQAYDRFYKACWNAAWKSPAFFALAQIDLARGCFSESLEHLQYSLDCNRRNGKALVLQAAALRKSGRRPRALDICKKTLPEDPFNIGILFEQYLSTVDSDRRVAENILETMRIRARGDGHTYIEYALDYFHAGLWGEASGLLSIYLDETENAYPIACYLMAYCQGMLGNVEAADRWIRSGEEASSDYCFPNRIEEVVILQWVIDRSSAPNALYYLGNLRYAFRQYDKAQKLWETALQQGSRLAYVHRNLALVYYNKSDRKEDAVYAMEKAWSLQPDSPRLLMELDQLYKKRNIDPAKRLALLEDNWNVAEYRDDLYLERLTLLNQSGRYDEVRQLMDRRRFHPWEGGEGKVSMQWRTALIGSAKEAIKQKRFKEAEALLKETFVYPENLGEGKLYGARENDVHYLLGCLGQMQDDPQEARFWFQKASQGDSEPAIPWYYNDQQPDKVFYQALAYAKEGDRQRGREILRYMIDFAEAELKKKVRIDYFAVSLPDILIWEDDLQVRNAIHCHYLIALGLFGLGRKEEAARHFDEVLRRDVNHLGSITHRRHLLDNTIAFSVE